MFNANGNRLTKRQTKRLIIKREKKRKREREREKEKERERD